MPQVYVSQHKNKIADKNRIKITWNLLHTKSTYNTRVVIRSMHESLKKYHLKNVILADSISNQKIVNKNEIVFQNRFKI